jgi:hypothetical protein
MSACNNSLPGTFFRVFEDISHHELPDLEVQICHLLSMIMTGPGGTGKMYFVNAVKSFMAHYG